MSEDTGETTQVPCPNGCLDDPPFLCPLCNNTGWCSINKAKEIVEKRAKESYRIVTYRQTFSIDKSTVI